MIDKLIGHPGMSSSGRDGVRSLIRRPLVQVALMVTAVAQVVMVQANGIPFEDSSGYAQLVEEPAVELAPAVVTPNEVVQTAWLKKAIVRESQRLAAMYRTEGYSVPPQLAAQIGVAAAEFEIEPEIAFGLVRAESSFRNKATSSVGAVGLTQLMPRTAAWMEPGVTRSELRDPETNLRIGFKYLRFLMDKYEGDTTLALLAYNRGPGTVDRALRRGRNPDNGYADFVRGKKDHGHSLFSR